VEEARRPVDNSRAVRSQRIAGWSEGTPSLFPLFRGELQRCDWSTRVIRPGLGTFSGVCAHR